MGKKYGIFTLSLILLLSAGSAVFAADGTKLIDQSRATAGGLTPGDGPGFPVTISRAGSYRLSGNLTVPNENTTAIEITADNVTLDLNGFSILGPTVCSGYPLSCAPLGTGKGVYSERHYVAVRNGQVRGMGSDGVRLRPAGGVSLGELVTDLQVQSNGGYGIVIGSGDVKNCIVTRNGNRGITIFDAGNAKDNNVSQNLGIGIYVNLGNASGNMVDYHPDGCGIYAAYGLVSNNTVAQNETGLCLGANVGYISNTIMDNSANLTGGVPLGQNLCDAGLCP